MKKKLLGIFLVMSSMVFANEYLQNNLGEIHSKIISNRGKEQFRKSIIFKKLDRTQYSGSNQYLEYIGEIENSYEKDKYNHDYDVKTKGFLMGTNSNFLKNPNIYGGVSFGYLKSKLDFEKDLENEKVRTYGLDYYIGKIYNNWLILGNLGYSESKNLLESEKYRSKVYNLGVESGYYYELGEKSLLYPYLTLNWNQYTSKAHGEIKEKNDRIGSSGLGINYYSEFWDKFLFSLGVEWNYEFSERENYKTLIDEKIKNLEVGRDTGVFTVKLGYYIQPDFLINIGYQSFLNKNYYYDMFSFGFSHNF